MAAPAPAHALERLTPPFTDPDYRDLASLLVESVRSGAVVTFLATLTHEDAESWWRRTVASASPRAIFYAARSAGRIIGTVQMHPAWAPNQPHRAEIAKLLVHPDHRRAGLGEALMRAIETAARDAGIRLLTLDTRQGDAAERLYRRTGWTEVGAIPRFAYDPDGLTPHAAVIFYKELC